MAQDTEEKKKKTTTKKKNTTGKKTSSKKTTNKNVKNVVLEEKETIKEEVKEEKTIVQNVLNKTDIDEKVSNVVQEMKDTVTDPVKVIVSGDLRKKPSAIIYLLVICLIIFMVLVSVYSYFHPKDEIIYGDFTYLGTYGERVFFTDYLDVSSREELNDFFPNTTFKSIDLNQNKYIVLAINTDPCSEENVKPVGYKVDGTTIYVTVEYTAHCGVCAPEYTYYLMVLDKSTYYDDVEYVYKATNDPHCNPNVAYKPLIYLYPTEETQVSVQLGHPEFLTTTYPHYETKWNVIAQPDGTLKDETGREYYGLFWEGNHHYATIKNDGFVVKGEEVYSFLEEKLSILGLTDKEAEEFIIYWLPKLESNPYNYIRFETMDEINQYMPLIVEPTPDTIIRIQMDYYPLNEKIEVEEQVLTTPNRSGFTLVEWGGSIIKD